MFQTRLVNSELSIAQFNCACVNLRHVLYETLANIIQKMMPLYGFHNLACVCVCTSETVCNITSLPVPSPPEDIVWTKNGPGNPPRFFFSGILVLSWPKNSIKRDLNACLHSLLYECLCAYMCVSGFMTVDWIRAK